MVRTKQLKYFFPKAEIKHSNVITEERNFSDQPIRNNINHMKLSEKVRKEK